MNHSPPEKTRSLRNLDHFGVVPFRSSDGEREVRLKCQVRFGRSVRKELTSKNPGISLRVRARAWRNGFSTRAWMLYQLNRNDHRKYLNDISSRRRIYRVNAFFNPIIDNKLMFYRLASQFGITHSKVVSTIVRGRLYPEAAQFGENPSEVLMELLKQHKRLVFKPTWSRGGQGIFFLEENEAQPKINGRDARPAD